MPRPDAALRSIDYVVLPMTTRFPDDDAAPNDQAVQLNSGTVAAEGGRLDQMRRLLGDVRPEEELLLLAARTHVDEEAGERLHALADAGDIDWPWLYDLGLHHRVLPLLFKSLERHAAGCPPEAMHAQLRTAYLSSAGLNLKLAAEAARLLNLIEDQGIPALPFKGPVLAKTAYGTLGLRLCAADIDLLISPANYAVIERLLIDDGYRLVQKVQRLRPDQKRVSLTIKRQFGFVRDGGLSIDLHTGIMPLGYHFPLTLEELWERARTVEVAGEEVRDCAPEDMLIILCYQGAKNLWERHKHVCDVAEVVRAHPDMDWTTVVERTRAMHGQRIVALGLYLAEVLAGAPVPPNVQEALGQYARVEPLAREVAPRLFQQQAEEASLRDRVGFHMALQTTWHTKLRYAAYTLFRRVEEMYESFTQT